MTEPTVERVTSAAPPRLAGVVDRLSGFARDGGAPGLHSVRASAHLKLVVGLGDAFEYATMADPEQRAGSYRAFVAGPHVRPAGVRHNGGQTAIEVEIRPMWAPHLLGVSVAEIGASVIDLEEVLGRRGEHLVDEVVSSGSWLERFGAIARFLVSRRGDSGSPPGDVVWAWEQIACRGGDVRVPQLAHSVGWSERQFRRRFQSTTGLGPKAAARIARFRHAERLAATGATSNHIAAACGYADQAHLSREVAALSRVPMPIDGVRNLQDQEAVRGEDGDDVGGP
jgi:AraC-like DNA-binding protein